MAGLDAVRVTSIWDPAQPDPTADELNALNNLDGGGQARRPRRRSSPVYNFGSRTTPLTDDDQASFAEPRRRSSRAGPRPPELHHRQRAEPEPLLAAAVQRGRLGRGRARLPVAARPHVRGAEGGRPDDRRSSAARSRRAGSTGPAPAATPTRRPSSSRTSGAAYRASGLTGPVMDALAIHPVPGELEHPADVRAPEHDADRDRRLHEARRPARPRRSTAPASPARRCRSSTPSTASRRRSRAAKASRVHGHGAGDDQARPRVDAGVVLPAGDGDVVLPAERHGPPDLPRVRRDGARPLPVGPLLPGRDAEVEPADRPRRGARRPRRRDREVRGPRADAEGQGRVSAGEDRSPPGRRRSASPATSTARSTRVSSGCRATRPRWSPARAGKAGERTLGQVPQDARSLPGATASPSA